MSFYLAIKHLHVLCVILSGVGFVLRGFWMLTDSPWQQRPVTRIAPHINDSVLFGAAIALAVMSDQYPFVAAWVTAKVLALLLYIVLGSLALKRGVTKSTRLLAGLMAMVVFAYIVSVALSRDAWGFLAQIGG